MKDALNRSKEYEVYYQKLGNDSKEKLFKNMKSVFTFAAVLGFKLGLTEPVIKTGGDPMKEHLFVDEMTIFDAIALLHTRDTKILLNENKEKKYQIIEEYANGGMHYIVDHIFNGTVTSHEKLLEFVLGFSEDVPDAPVDMAALVGGIVDDLT